ncbi:NADP-dependent oxidoreductase [Agilicoccus flavus]|uniref:NADP-dependent oxidoreductase n=1 Tax=Agilicoccus flavus TaxID=2775968 RepID=UPI001CF61187|nr:NADP-dependent oxidoreductase [Agilicoccus flavus]
MRVIGVQEYGGPEALAAHEVPEPHAGPGQVRIAVAAAAVNPTDTNAREGAYGESELPPPHVPGMDAAGVVDEVGEPTAELDTSRRHVGDEVMAIALPQRGHGGAYVQYLVADADSLATIPAGRSLVEASTLPMNGLTALQALDKLGLEPGQVLAVTGAAGTLGGYVVELAKDRGLTVIADAADKDRDRVLGFGADHVVPRGDDVAARIREIYPDGVDGLVDAAVQNELALPAVRSGGGFATVRRWPGVEGSDVTVHSVWVFDDYHRGDRLDDLRRAVEDGVLTLAVADTLPAEQAADAHRRLAQGGTRGRLVLTF